MLYNFVADSFHTKKFCTRHSAREVRFYTEIGCFAFLSLVFWGRRGLGAMYDDHFRLIEKHVMDFL